MAVNVISCAVYGCTNSTLSTSDPAIQYYYFPKHPVIAQHWMNACLWRPDELDPNTARICSIHFDAASYTNEYKKSDYLSYYTKVLKYDAVPTLHLPYQSIIKTAISDSIEIQTESSELKPIIVYNITNPADHSYTTYETTAVIEANAEVPASDTTAIDIIHHTVTGDMTVNIVDNTPIENVQDSYNSLTKVNLEEYGKIKTYADYVKLKSENNKLFNDIAQIEKNITKLNEAINSKSENVKKKELEVNKLRRQYNSLERRSLSLTEQKQLLSKVFSESQIKILSGKKKIYWSNDDMAVGYTIRHMSNKRCYMYLSKSLNIPLPALSSIKRWATMKKSENGKTEVKEEEKFEDSE